MKFVDTRKWERMLSKFSGGSEENGVSKEIDGGKFFLCERYKLYISPMTEDQERMNYIAHSLLWRCSPCKGTELFLVETPTDEWCSSLRACVNCRLSSHLLRCSERKANFVWPEWSPSGLTFWFSSQHFCSFHAGFMHPCGNCSDSNWSYIVLWFSLSEFVQFSISDRDVSL